MTTTNESVASLSNAEKAHQLENWGFNLVDINMILKNDSQFELICKHRAHLIEHPHPLTPQQITKLTNLLQPKFDTVINNLPFLKMALNSIDDIISIASKRDGIKTISCLIQHYTTLINQGFGPLLAKLINHRGGSQSIKAVCQYNGKAVYQELCLDPEILQTCERLKITKEDFIFSPETFTGIVGHESGLNNLDAFKKHYIYLRDLGFTLKHVLTLVSTQRGALNIESLVANAKKFLEHGYSHDQIIQMHKIENGYQIATSNLKQLEAGTPKENIKTTTTEYHREKSKPIFKTSIAKETKQLSRAWGLTPTQIESIFYQKGGGLTIAFLKEKYTQLANLLQEVDDKKKSKQVSQAIYKLANHKGGRSSLKAILDYYQILRPHFNRAQIVSMASPTGGCKNLEAVARSLSIITDPNFPLSPEQITEIVSCQGGGKKLYDLVHHRKQLFESKTPDEVYEYYRKGGNKRAAFFLNPNLDAMDEEELLNEDPFIDEAQDNDETQSLSPMSFKFFTTKNNRKRMSETVSCESSTVKRRKHTAKTPGFLKNHELSNTKDQEEERSSSGASLYHSSPEFCDNGINAEHPAAPNNTPSIYDSFKLLYNVDDYGDGDVSVDADISERRHSHLSN